MTTRITPLPLPTAREMHARIGTPLRYVGAGLFAGVRGRVVDVRSAYGRQDVKVALNGQALVVGWTSGDSWIVESEEQAQRVLAASEVRP